MIGVDLRDARTGRRVKLLRLPDEARTVAFSRDGALVATGDSVVRDILYDGHPAPEPGAERQWRGR